MLSAPDLRHKTRLGNVLQRPLSKDRTTPMLSPRCVCSHPKDWIDLSLCRCANSVPLPSKILMFSGMLTFTATSTSH